MTRAGGEGGRRWAILALLSAAELLGMSLWFTASAVAPELRDAWSLSPSEAGGLTSVVQLGFVAGTGVAALLNLADVFPSRVYFSASALLGATANAALLVVPGYRSALAARFLTGFFLAGVYPPAMKMAATWFRSARGLAIGTIVGALTVGKALPYLVRSTRGAELEPVVIGASGAAVLGGLLVLMAYRDGPYPFDRRPFSWGLVGTIVRHRKTMLATGGYLGHMWELYAMWTLISLFFHDVFQGRTPLSTGVDELSALMGFFVIAIGGVGAVLAGKWADALGRERVTIGSMVVSGVCSLVIGWLVAAPVWVVVGLGLVWGFAIVADSAQFSAVVTEVAPSHAVGTALTLQTMLGFALTGVSIQLATWLSGTLGWGGAFSVLALGPILGIVSMLRLRALRAGETSGFSEFPDAPRAR